MPQAPRGKARLTLRGDVRRGPRAPIDGPPVAPPPEGRRAIYSHLLPCSCIMFRTLSGEKILQKIVTGNVSACGAGSSFELLPPFGRPMNGALGSVIRGLPEIMGTEVRGNSGVAALRRYRQVTLVPPQHCQDV